MNDSIKGYSHQKPRPISSGRHKFVARKFWENVLANKTTAAPWNCHFLWGIITICNKNLNRTFHTPCTNHCAVYSKTMGYIRLVKRIKIKISDVHGMTMPLSHCRRLPIKVRRLSSAPSVKPLHGHLTLTPAIYAILNANGQSLQTESTYL